ncbi:ABC transporter permease [Amycolatopsis saalfeldensis]|uniref:ABC-2 type transport system permease protein n=1 Tax=Amycolatopsis saalfeldensis TaxID=394193 RepID=A0A1H8Y766_9PSEU|nr:ABC transporter permease [Amycolatopsis saalfeldensis]SEP47841.1 ABC-2 type transport system permease protein [Amycolatopsis saalfeldensis]
MTTTETVRGGGLSGAIASEWTKLWSVRATWWCLSGGLLTMLLYSGVSGLSQHIGDNRPEGAHSMVAAGAIYMTEFFVIAVATLFVTSEYANGGIRSTLQWVPVRRQVPVAKAAVLVPVLFGYGLVVALAGMALGGSLMGSAGLPTSFGTGLLTAVGMGAFFALLGVLCLGVGFALRSAAGTIVTVMVLLLPLPMLLSSYVWQGTMNYFPAFAGLNAMTAPGSANPLFGGPPPYGMGVGVVICLVWAAAGLLVGTAVLKRRDA